MIRAADSTPRIKHEHAPATPSQDGTSLSFYEGRGPSADQLSRSVLAGLGHRTTVLAGLLTEPPTPTAGLPNLPETVGGTPLSFYEGRGLSADQSPRSVLAGLPTVPARSTAGLPNPRMTGGLSSTIMPASRDADPEFDDSALPEPIRRRLKVRTAAIHKRLDIRRIVTSAKAVVQVGLRLKIVRDLVGRQHFQAWLRASFCWKQPRATKFMRSAAVFKTVDCLNNFQPSALYRLARKNVPPVALAEALARARAGEYITQSRADAIVRARREVPEEPDDEIEEACRIIEEALDGELDSLSRARIDQLRIKLATAALRVDHREIFPGNISRQPASTCTTRSQAPSTTPRSQAPLGNAPFEAPLRVSFSTL